MEEKKQLDRVILKNCLAINWNYFLISCGVFIYTLIHTYVNITLNNTR